MSASTQTRVKRRATYSDERPARVSGANVEASSTVTISVGSGVDTEADGFGASHLNSIKDLLGLRHVILEIKLFR